MPLTRSEAKSNHASGEEKPDAQSRTTNNGPSESKSKGRKRLSDDKDAPSKPATKKRANTEPKSPAAEQEPRPRLTTPDLEYDYDRSQLRDPRPTPGRVKRPRWSDRDLSEEWKAKFYIPEPQKPSGRLNSVVKDKLLREKALLDPSMTFHDLHRCHKKGRSGSPTYDSAGFRLDWHKVDRWMQPKPYNKKSMVNGMNKAVDKMQKDNRQMYEMFFKGGKPPKDVDSTTYEHYMKDQVSKDLDVPIHQITPTHFQKWERVGFQKPEADLWWRAPNEEERKRALNMLSGASLRKDL